MSYRIYQTNKRLASGELASEVYDTSLADLDTDCPGFVAGKGKRLFVGTDEECMNYCDKNELVAEVGGVLVTKSLLRYAFEKVENKKNWKLPIAARVYISEAWDKELIAKAIEFFTGSKATFAQGRGMVQVSAPGYYAACGI
jgi:hypothetical protein